MLTLSDHVGQVITRFPSAEWHVAFSVVKQAAMLVYAEHPWSWAVQEGRITTEAAYRTGHVKLVKGSTAVVGVDGTAWDPTWALRRFVGPGRNEDYKITLTGAATATLSHPWLGESVDAADYLIFRDEYPVPAGCDYGREFFILDPENNRVMRFKDLGVFIRERARRAITASSSPEWVTRVGNDATGAPLLRFGPEPPTSIEGYPIIFFAQATMPVNENQSITPLMPTQFEDLIWRRARWLYAEERGKRLSERDDLRRIYWERHYDAVKVCDGGAEVDRRIATQYPSLYEDFAAFINITIPED